MFNKLWAMGMFPDDPFAAMDPEDQEEIPAGPVLDVFSGTGSMGLESLSRGARQATFVDTDKVAIERLQQNLDELGIKKEHYKIVQSSAMGLTWIGMLPERVYAMAFIDPPYRFMNHETHPDERERIVAMMSKLAGVVHEEGVMVLRMPSDLIAPIVEDWKEPLSLKYGSMTVHIYEQ